VLTNTKAKLREAIAEVRGVEGPFPDDVRDAILEDVESLRAGLELLEAAVTSQDADWDAGLARLLEERQ
jgi:hypothetical protein